MYGLCPQLPIDIEFGVTQTDISGHSHENYSQKLKATLKWAYKVVKETSFKELKRHKQYYDHKFHYMALAPGDIVLVRTKALGQDYKIADKWEHDPYIVLSQMGSKPVFKVKPKNARNQEEIGILHWNMLYPIQSVQGDAQDVTAHSLVKSVMALTSDNLFMALHFDDV